MDVESKWTDYHLKYHMHLDIKCGTRRCDLCLTENMIIALADQKSPIEQKN